MTRRNDSRRRLALALSLTAVAATGHATEDLTELSLEKLLDIEVVSASRVAQRASDAPSAVTVLQREDFRAHGWRTLAEALNSVRGVLASTGGEYTYAALRGFATPGDYNSRLLLMIDGIRSNDPYFDSAYIGDEFPLDLDLIERIEVVRGPGSMVYGGNALFGVINVITRAGKDVGVEAAVSAGSFRSLTGRLSHGRELANGADLLLSFSGLNSDGQAHFYPELGQASPGTEDSRTRRFFGRYRQGEFAFSAIARSREHGRPNGAFGSVFDDPRNRDWDDMLLLDTRYQVELAGATRLAARLFYGWSEWRGQYVNDNADAGVPPYDLDKERAQGEWWGVDAQLHHDGFAGHRLLFGVDYQNNLRQDQFAEDAPPALRCTATGSAAEPCFADRRSSYRLGLYLQDDLKLAEGLNLHLGLRHDRSDASASQWSPRLGLIWRPDGENVAKLVYGRAFRAPNVYERYYTYPGVGAQIANPDLRAETIETVEAVWERYLGKDLRLVFGAHVDHVNGWIVQVNTPDGLQFRNQPAIRGGGIDFEVEQRFAGGARLRASYAGQFVPERPNGNINGSPRHQLKANFATPLPLAGWQLGLEGRYASGQVTSGGRTAGYAVANANLRWQTAAGTELALGVYNLFDRRYGHSYPDDSLVSGIPRESMPQDGRSWQLKLTQNF